MLFSTPFFCFAFLPAFFLLYFLVPAKRVVLLAGSLLFYAWGEPVFLFVVLASSVLDWLLGWMISRRKSRAGLVPLALGIAANLGVLVYTKYAFFALTNWNYVLDLLAQPLVSVPKVALPLGVSFIVFEKITYLVDIRRGAAKPARSLLDYLNYVFLFPKLLAGPIVKYHDIADQLTRPSFSWRNL
jgi:alginate O-acetyltransferase complex protein AlgI